MKLKTTFLLWLLFFSMSAIATNSMLVSHSLMASAKTEPAESSFDNDDFFSEKTDVFQAMAAMEQAMNRLVNDNFSTEKKIITSQPILQIADPLKDVVITEKGDVITYKIKLPSSSNNKVTVNSEKGKLKVTVAMTEKNISKSGNNESVSYSHSSQSKTFLLPLNYQEKTLKSQIKGNKVLVTFTKKPSTQH